MSTATNIEIRTKDGLLDEIVIKVGNECILHLEYMGDKSWWAGIYGEAGDMYHLNFTVADRLMLAGQDNDITVYGLED